MVIAIIAILIALLLPAVQQAREAARRSTCKNSLKQLALALHNYHESHGQFPPGAVYVGPSTDGVAQSGFGSSYTAFPGRTHGWGATWVTMLLPFVDQKPLYDNYQMSTPSGDPINRPVTRTRLPSLYCPSTERSVLAGTDGRGGRPWGEYAKITYGMNGGSDEFNDGHDWLDRRERGIVSCGPSMGARIADIKDGVSSTIMLGELWVADSRSDCRGCWAHGTGPFIASRGGNGQLRGNFSGMLTPNKLLRDLASFCDNGVRGNGRCDDRGSTSRANNFKDVAHSVRSRHTGGAHIGLCDGSVRFVSSSIDGGIWYALLTSKNSSDTREPIVGGF